MSRKKSTHDEKLHDAFVEVIRRTSTELPKDVSDCIEAGRAQESPSSRGENVLGIIEKNIKLAKVKSQPLCQDTGSVLFFVRYPKTMDRDALSKLLRKSVASATRQGYLRQNIVETLTGKMSETNVAPGSPILHMEPWSRDGVEVRLILKGAGCENVGGQYSLPDMRLEAGRDLKGVRRCIIDAVQQAQGRGCGPGILGVTIGGDRATGYLHSKEQFLRKMTDKNPQPELALLEAACTQEANQLGIGPMGLGGKTTLLGVKVGVLSRLPGSYFVSVSYMCWAFRRQGARITPKGDIRRWLY